MRKWWGSAIAVICLIAVYVCYCLLRPLQIGAITINLDTPTAGDFTLDDLGLGRAAVGYIDPSSGAIQCRALGAGDGYTVPRATASLAKLITVQVVLDKYPLAAGESGPLITMSGDDEARYWWVVNAGGSNARVVAGEQISQRQLIEGILLASANNMADSLVIWAFGSMDSYHQAATEWLANNGLSSTTVGGDASGFDPATKSTPTDLCKIMLLAAQEPALAEIMSEPEVTLPTGDVIHTTNQLLGQNGVFAGKTGYTDEAGRGMLAASRQNINGADVIVAGASLSNDSYEAAFSSTAQLIALIPQNLQLFGLDANTNIGRITTPWTEDGLVTLTHGLTVPYWVDQPPQISATVVDEMGDSLSPNSIVGRLAIDSNEINLVTSSGVAPATAMWRLSHPLN